MENVVRPVALHEDRLEVTLELHTSALRDLSVNRACEKLFPLVRCLSLWRAYFTRCRKNFADHRLPA